MELLVATCPRTDEVITILPPLPWSAITFPAARHIRNVWRTLASITMSKSPGEASWELPGLLKPEATIRMSKPPWTAFTSSIIAYTFSSVSGRRLMPLALPPAELMASTNASSFCFFAPASITVAPAPARRPCRL